MGIAMSAMAKNRVIMPEIPVNPNPGTTNISASMSMTPVAARKKCHGFAICRT